MSQSPDYIPVIIGTGQINDRPAEPIDGLEPAALMEASLRKADADAGGGWLERLDSLMLVAQISFPDLGDVAPALAARVGAAPRLRGMTALPHGDAPIRLLNDAANAIAKGEIRVAAVAGAEALRTAMGRRAVSSGPRNRFSPPSPLAARYGLVHPIDIYPLYENATRAAWGQSLAVAQDESATIWSGMSKVAATSDGAWLKHLVDTRTVKTPSADNRPIAHPYTKLMVANAAVNQGAAFIVTSLAEARARGISDERLVYVGAGAAAHEPDDFLLRDGFTHSAGMEASIAGALGANHLAAADLDAVELYSCFPCVPKMARRLIDWGVDQPVTAFGGLTFGGGPIGNYMSHAVAAMTDHLRRQPGTALLFANGGYATQNHSIIIGSTPFDGLPHGYDHQAVADANRGAVPMLVDSYAGAATIETYTVLYDREGKPRHGAIVARTTDGSRTMARVAGDDHVAIASLTDGAIEPVGRSGQIALGTDGLNHWAFEQKDS